MTRCALPKTPHRRVSPDNAWPIRRADGLTPAQVRPHYRPAALGALNNGGSDG